MNILYYSCSQFSLSKKKDFDDLLTGHSFSKFNLTAKTSEGMTIQDFPFYTNLGLSRCTFIFRMCNVHLPKVTFTTKFVTSKKSSLFSIHEFASKIMNLTHVDGCLETRFLIILEGWRHVKPHFLHLENGKQFRFPNFWWISKIFEILER